MKLIVLFLSFFGILSMSCQNRDNKEEKTTPETSSTTSPQATVKVVPEYLTQEAFKTKVADYTSQEFIYLGEQPCVIDIYAVWCGPCKKLAPVLEELANEYKGSVTFYKSDAEKETELASAIGIRSYPTLLFIAKDKKPIFLEGAYPKEHLRKIIEENLLASSKL